MRTKTKIEDRGKMCTMHLVMSVTSISRTAKKLWESRAATLVVILLGIAAMFWITTYKIMDRDFWWHITAGKVMFATHALITIEPFSYTRAGLPYLASYEWLSQIILYLLYHTWGSTGIILFRGVVATTCMGLLFTLTKQKRLAYVLLAVWAIVITKGAYLERPQLFSYIFLAAFIALAFRFLDTESWRKRIAICASFVVLSVLWVNTHGGAALVGCAIVSFLGLQTAFSALSPYKRGEHLRTGFLLLGTLLLLAGTLVSTPDGLGSLHYLSQLMSDKTISFIAEWQPRTWGLYIQELWPFFVLSLLALWYGRRHWVFNGLLLLMTIYLSRQAFRHEILFIYAAVATCFYQGDRSETIEKLWTWMKQHMRSMTIVTVLAVLVLGRMAYLRSFGFERQDNLFGYGQFDLARSAYDFVEREKISGNMFNTYGIGGYLIYRGYPDRKVFIDGRNVDYGFDFMARTYAAGINPDRWNELVNQYNISYALVDYDAIKQQNQLPYSSILDTHPDWALVYLDDWVAVYLKKTTVNAPIIARLRFAHVNASTLQFADDFGKAAPKDMPAIKKELLRVQADNPEGIKATIALAKIALRENRLDDALSLATTAARVRPTNPEPLAILAGIYVNQQQWEKAAQTYEDVLRLAGDNYPDINYAFIANVFEKAGHSWKAWYYRLGSKVVPSASQPAVGGAQSSVKPSLAVNPGADAEEFHAQGLAQAESGQLVEAEQSFLTALKINPSFGEAWNNLCALYVNLKRSSDAIDACKRAIALDAKYGDAHYNLALALVQTHALDAASQEALLAKKWGRAKEADALLLFIKKQSH